MLSHPSPQYSGHTASRDLPTLVKLDDIKDTISGSIDIPFFLTHKDLHKLEEIVIGMIKLSANNAAVSIVYCATCGKSLEKYSALSNVISSTNNDEDIIDRLSIAVHADCDNKCNNAENVSIQIEMARVPLSPFVYLIAGEQNYGEKQ